MKDFILIVQVIVRPSFFGTEIYQKKCCTGETIIIIIIIIIFLTQPIMHFGLVIAIADFKLNSPLLQQQHVSLVGFHNTVLKFEMMASTRSTI